MGIASKDIKGFVEITAKLSSAFQLGPDEAGTSIGKLINLFSLSIPQVEKLGDAINQLGNKPTPPKRTSSKSWFAPAAWPNSSACRPSRPRRWPQPC